MICVCILACIQLDSSLDRLTTSGKGNTGLWHQCNDMSHLILGYRH